MITALHPLVCGGNLMPSARKSLLITRLLAAFASALVLAGIAACDVAKRDDGGRVLVRSIGGQPGSLDPQRAEDQFSFDVLRDLYEGLTASTPEGEAIPAGAESWSVSEDGITWRFRLRSVARWSDGTPVLARHYVNGLRRAVDPATASGGADLLRVIENAVEVLRGEMPPDRLGVAAVSDTELEIRLVRPVPYLPDILTNTVTSPVADAALAGDTYRFSDPASLVSNGPYRLAAVVPGASLKLVKSASYRDRANVAFEQVRYEIVADEMAEFTRFRSGELDVTHTVPEQHFEALHAEPGSGLQYRPALATFYYSFNTVSGPLKDRPRLREALSLAIDRDAITGLVTRAGQTPAWSLVPPGVWNYSSQQVQASGLDRAARHARARALLAADRGSGKTPMKLRMLYNDNQLVERVSLAIAAAWQEVLGVEVELRKMEFRAYLAARDDPSQWDVARVGWAADYNDASSFLDTLMTGSPQNFGRWRNEGYERLLANAAVEIDAGERRALLERAEALMLAEHPVMPVYFYVLRRLVSPRVKAPEINALNRSYSRDFRPAGE